MVRSDKLSKKCDQHYYQEYIRDGKLLKMREGGLEPLWFGPLDSKSSASASSATLAC
jgi:hypothetical protein